MYFLEFVVTWSNLFLLRATAGSDDTFVWIREKLAF